jgi:hypothetical protein
VSSAEISTINDKKYFNPFHAGVRFKYIHVFLLMKDLNVEALGNMFVLLRFSKMNECRPEGAVCALS